MSGLADKAYPLANDHEEHVGSLAIPLKDDEGVQAWS